MFVGSAKTPEEMISKIANTQIGLAGRDAFHKLMSEKYPNCYGHYENRRNRFNTTWKIEPSELIYLFESIEDKVICLDYIINLIDPKPTQKIALQEIINARESINGKKLIEILGWYDGAGLEKKYEIYKR